MDIEIEITRDGDALHVIARGSQGERPLPHYLGPDVGQAQLDAFSARVARVLKRPVGDLPLDDARALHAALFRDELKTVLDRALDPSRPDAAKAGMPLVRLLLRDPALQAIPWEALCEPRTEEILGASQRLRFARGVTSKDPFQAREVRGALRFLAIAPTSAEDALKGLRDALHEPIRAGELEWLPPITGSRAAPRQLFDSLRAADSPHILHFLGHGGLDSKARPELRIGDEHGMEEGDNKGNWVTAELLGQELASLFQGDLRLVHLEACEGAAPGAFGSAAEILCRAGADAVVAHLWPVIAPTARACARHFYRALISASSASKGDVVASLGAARRALLLSSAEGLSPVVYLRGPGSLVFDLAKRRVRPAAPEPDRPGLDPALARLLQRPFSLVLGDTGQDQLAGRDQLRRELATKLAEADHRHGAAIPSLSVVAQRFELCFGQTPLRRLFGQAFQQMLTSGDLDVPRGIDALARLLRPGVHATLLWVPLLESAIARRHPGRAVYVLTPPGPSDHEISVTIRPAGSEKWDMAMSLPDPGVLDEAFVVLRLYGGYLPGDTPELTSLFVTEDDYIHGLRHVEQRLPVLWVEAIRHRLDYRPALFTGISALKWRHRMLLQWLFNRRSVPKDSIALLAASGGDDERQVWTKRGGGLPGEGSVATVTASRDDLAPLLDALDPAVPL